MQVSPINSYNYRPNFNGTFNFYMNSVPKNVLQNVQPSALTMWDRNTVCEAFKNLMEEFKNLEKYKKSFKFQKLYELHKSMGLKSTLYMLGMNKSNLLEEIMGPNNLFQEVKLSNSTNEFGDEMIIKNRGPWGFWRNLLGLSGKNEISIEFKDWYGNNLEFSLDKKDDYVVYSTSYHQGEFTEYKVSYFADKDKMKKEILPQIDLLLPPGL